MRGATDRHQRAEVVVVRLYFHDTAERDRLATEWGADEVATTGGYLTVWTDRATYNQMLAQGLRAEIDQRATRPGQQPQPVRAEQPRHLLRRLQDRRGDADLPRPASRHLSRPWPRRWTIGNSWCKDHAGSCTRPAPTWNGYDLLALHITNQAIAGPKPVFWYDAGIHAREIATPEIAMRYIQWLLDGYNSDADAHWLVDYHDIWVMPMLNPDGHHMVEQRAAATAPITSARTRTTPTAAPPGRRRRQPARHRQQPQLPLHVELLRRLQRHCLRQTYHGPSAGLRPRNAGGR